MPFSKTRRAASTGAVSPTARIRTLDVLRGFALFGVLAVNIYDWLGEPAGTLDQVAELTTAFFFENKFWPLFSFLFGLGFALQLDRATAKGEPVLWIHLRRMAVLWMFGVVLVALFAGNPILMRYALLGMLLLPFRRLSPGFVLTAAFITLLAASAMRPLWVIDFQRTQAERTAQPVSVPPEDSGREPPVRPTFVETTVQAFRNAVRMPGRPVLWAAGMVELFTMFLVGLYVGKLRLHKKLTERRRLMFQVMLWGLGFGFLGTGVHLALSDWSTLAPSAMLLSNFARCAGGDSQALGYAAVVVLVAPAAHSRVFDLLASAGRLPLTNYMAQWLILRVAFDRYFFGLEGTIGPAGGFFIVGVIFVAQLLWSQWWVARFQFGPTEWLWKTLAYWKPQPMRVPPTVLGSATPI